MGREDRKIISDWQEVIFELELKDEEDFNGRTNDLCCFYGTR